MDIYDTLNVTLSMLVFRALKDMVLASYNACCLCWDTYCNMLNLLLEYKVYSGTASP
jgi:hypothetical protein